MVELAGADRAKKEREKQRQEEKNSNLIASHTVAEVKSMCVGGKKKKNFKGNPGC